MRMMLLWALMSGAMAWAQDAEPNKIQNAQWIEQTLDADAARFAEAYKDDQCTEELPLVRGLVKFTEEECILTVKVFRDNDTEMVPHQKIVLNFAESLRDEAAMVPLYVKTDNDKCVSRPGVLSPLKYKEHGGDALLAALAYQAKLCGGAMAGVELPSEDSAWKVQVSQLPVRRPLGGLLMPIEKSAGPQ